MQLKELSENSQQSVYSFTMLLQHDQLVDQLVKELESRVNGILINTYGGHELTVEEKTVAAHEAIKHILDRG